MNIPKNAYRVAHSEIKWTFLFQTSSSSLEALGKHISWRISKKSLMCTKTFEKTLF